MSSKRKKARKQVSKRKKASYQALQEVANALIVRE